MTNVSPARVAFAGRDCRVGLAVRADRVPTVANGERRVEPVAEDGVLNNRVTPAAGIQDPPAKRVVAVALPRLEPFQSLRCYGHVIPRRIPLATSTPAARRSV